MAHEIGIGVLVGIDMGRRMTATDLFMRAKCLLEKRVNEWETIESFIIPVLMYLGWHVTYFGHRVKLYRNSSSDFDLVFAKGKEILLAVEAKRISTDILATSANKSSESASNCSLPVQVATYATKRDGSRSRFDLDKNYTHVLWTNGVHWVHFEDCSWNGVELNDVFKSTLTESFRRLKHDKEVPYFKRTTILEKTNGDWSEEIFIERLEELKFIIGYNKVRGKYQTAQQRGG